jgi:hypothetical protein
MNGKSSLCLDKTLLYTGIEVVDSMEDLTIKSAYIKQKPKYGRKQLAPMAAIPIDENQPPFVIDDQLRRWRGTVVATATDEIIQQGGVYPYEYTVEEQKEMVRKMEDLDHVFGDMTVEKLYEGTVIRVFYFKGWHVSTHNKINAGASKWGSTRSFKELFESGLKHDYGMSLHDLFETLNVKFCYTFMLMADADTRFACQIHDGKRVYLLGSSDPSIDQWNKVDFIPKILEKFDSLEDVFNHVNNMQQPFEYQGLLLIHKEGSQYSIKSDKYIEMFNVRNNVPSIPFRYLQLKCQHDEKSADILMGLFPQHNATIESHKKYINVLVETIHKEYVEYIKRRAQKCTNTPPIDQKLYLFIKNKLAKLHHKNVTLEKILNMLWFEEPSNLNHMIQTMKMTSTPPKSPRPATPQNPITVVDQSHLLRAPKKKICYKQPLAIDIRYRRTLF